MSVAAQLILGSVYPSWNWFELWKNVCFYCSDVTTSFHSGQAWFVPSTVLPKVDCLPFCPVFVKSLQWTACANLVNMFVKCISTSYYIYNFLHFCMLFSISVHKAARLKPSLLFGRVLGLSAWKRDVWVGHDRGLGGPQRSVGNYCYEIT